MLENLAHLHYSCIYEGEEVSEVCLEPAKAWITLSLAACAWMTNSQSAEAAVQAPTLQYGDSGEAVVNLQNQLKQAGCFPQSTTSTGYYGRITQEAVSSLQSQNALLVDGIAGKQTNAALAANQTCGVPASSTANAVLKLGDRGKDVELLQKQLNNWGFPLDPKRKLLNSENKPTSVFDAETQKALQEFEEFFGLQPQDGIFDAQDSQILWESKGKALARLMSKGDDFSAKGSTALIKMGPSATPDLIALLESEEKDDRFVAAYAIYVLKHGRSSEVIEPPELKSIVPPLVKLLKSDSKDDRFVAASALGDIGADAGAEVKDAVPLLINLLKSQDKDDLAIAADALGGIWESAKLGSAEKDDRAVAALGEIRKSAKKTVDNLIPLLTDNRVASMDNLSVSYLAISALEKMGSDAKAAIPALVDQLQYQNPKDEKGKKIRKAALALAKIAPSETSKLFQAPALGDNKTRRGVAFAIGAKESVEPEVNVDPKVVGKLQEIVQNPNENLELRKTAAISSTLLTHEVNWLYTENNFAPLAEEWKKCPRRKSEAKGGEEERELYFDAATRKCQLQDLGVGNGIKMWGDWFKGKIGKQGKNQGKSKPGKQRPGTNWG